MRLARTFLLALTALLPNVLNAKETVQQLPRELHGTWAEDLEDCSNPDSEGLLKVEAKLVDSYAFKLRVTRVKRLADGTVRASGFAHIEGERGPEPSWLDLKLLSADELMFIEHAFYRCTRSLG